ncbi:MAG: flagellar motor switch protein FliN [Candidatus Kapabacteria bacterium]|nr:flagellar motor switch protein FliN [Candidatus Kapabacteria bacterium]MDW8012325.1 flagellar motor switch protein FliN [Bacteroidota bacterium]
MPEQESIAPEIPESGTAQPSTGGEAPKEGFTPQESAQLGGEVRGLKAEEFLHDPKLELLFSIQLPVSVELGRTMMFIRDILRLGRGSVIEFERLITDPVDVLVNGKKIAEGEVVVIDKHFGIRITTLVEPAERLHGLRR